MCMTCSNSVGYSIYLMHDLTIYPLNSAVISQLRLLASVHIPVHEIVVISITNGGIFSADPAGETELLTQILVNCKQDHSSKFCLPVLSYIGSCGKKILD